MHDVAHIEAVAVTGPSTLAVTWGDGSISPVDLAGWIGRGTERIAPLGNALVFSHAAVGLYGGNVTWDGDEGDLAIDSEHLRMLAEHQAPFDGAAAAAWQDDMEVSNSEAADLIGIAPSTWAAYKGGAAIPATVARLCKAMKGAPTILSAHLRPRTVGNPGKGPIFVDGRQPADLRVSGVTTSGPTLQQAVLAFLRLTGEEQVRASIALPGKAIVYSAAAIRRLHSAPGSNQIEGHDAARRARSA